MEFIKNENISPIVKIRLLINYSSFKNFCSFLPVLSGKERIKEKELEIRLVRENIDASENHDRFVVGHRHPLNKNN